VAERAAGAHGGASGRADRAAAQGLCGARSRGGDLYSLRVLAGSLGACTPSFGGWLLRGCCASWHSRVLVKGRRSITRSLQRRLTHGRDAQPSLYYQPCALTLGPVLVGAAECC
jgi:hypothetical protein